MIRQEDVTIIIPTFSQGPQEEVYALRECINSLLETCSCKIIVSYNGVGEIKEGAITGSFIRSIVQNQERISYIQIQEQGQNKAVNAAIAITNTPWVFITNDDMIYAPGWIEELICFTDKYSCISPQLVEPRKGAPTFIEYFCGGAGGDFDKEKFLLFAKERNRLNQSTNQKVLVDRIGFNLPLLIKRDVWDTIGGYDIEYDPWGSNGDSDLEYKIRLAGIQPMQIAGCLVYHFSQTSGTFEPRNDSFRMRNYAYFKEKWGFDRTDIGIWEANFHMPTKEEGRIFLPEWEGKYGTTY